MSSESGIVTASELLRRKVQQQKTSQSVAAVAGTRAPSHPLASDDIDEEIKRLEAELAKGSDSSDSDDDSHNDDLDHGQDTHNAVRGKTTITSNIDNQSPSVLRLSELEQDRIQSLPQHLLPAARKRTLKNIDGEGTKSNKKVSKASSESSGLASAVKEVLSGYVARSSEKLPFYCRACQKQYPNEKEFFEHKATEFHKTAVDVERRASYCKLCRKQLTSPEQLKEHLKSRPHKERLERARERNLPGRGRGGYHHPGNRGRGRGYVNRSQFSR